MKFSPVFKALAVVSMLATAAATAQAASDDDAIELRKTAMKGIGASMGGLKMVVQGKAGTDMAKGFADAMAAYASVTGGLFPKGSDFGDTRAKEEIWTKADEFKAALMASSTSSVAISTGAPSIDRASARLRRRSLW